MKPGPKVGFAGSLPERLFAKVDIRDERSCWNWTAATSKKRRGQRRPSIRLPHGSPRLTASAARLVCEWLHGPPPSELHEAGHTCPDGENDVCVNYHHLQWMTRFENEQYKQSRRHEHDEP